MSSREDELLAAFFRHHNAEESKSVELTMATVTDDIVYEHPFRVEDRHVDGPDAVRAYYARQLPKRNFEEFRVGRRWLCGDDTLILEFEAVHGGSPRTRSPGFAIVSFRDGLVSREIVIGGPSRTIA